MHKDCRKSNMLTLLHHCLIAVSLAGSLMPLCCGGGKIIHPEHEYESTPSPDYDYNATFDYSFFSNSTTDDLEMIWLNNESEHENEELDITRTNPLSTVPTSSDEAFGTVYSSLLLVLMLAVHHLLGLQ